MTETLLVNQQSNILEIQLNRPEKLNALTDAMYAKLVSALVDAESNTAISVVLIRSSSKHFSAGNDLADFLETPFDESSHVVQFLLTLASMNKPIIAAVSGAAVGIGTTMLLHCDLVYAAANSKFSLPFIKLGLSPEGASSRLLAERCGAARANDWLLTGRTFLAEEAYQAGLVNAVYETLDQVWDTANEMAEQLASSPQAALLSSKRLLKARQRESILQLIKEEAEIFAENLKSDDAQQAFARFLNK